MKMKNENENENKQSPLFSTLTERDQIGELHHGRLNT